MKVKKKPSIKFYRTIEMNFTVIIRIKNCYKLKRNSKNKTCREPINKYKITLLRSVKN